MRIYEILAAEFDADFMVHLMRLTSKYQEPDLKKVINRAVKNNSMPGMVHLTPLSVLLYKEIQTHEKKKISVEDWVNKLIFDVAEAMRNDGILPMRGRPNNG